MIKMVTEYDLSIIEFCKKDVFGTRISAYFSSYQCKYDFMKIWAQYNNDNELSAVLSLIDASFTLCADEAADFNEIQMFIKMTPFSTLQCKKNIAKLLGFNEALSGCIVEYTKKINIKPPQDAYVNMRPDIKEVYKIAKANELIGVGEMLPWISDATFRINRGYAKALSVDFNNESVACAMVLFENENAALLGCVATKAEFRGRGYAGYLVNMLCRLKAKENKRCELLCKNGSIIRFYNSIGFEKTGEWSIIEGSENL